MAVLLAVLGGIGVYGYYTGKLSSSADELEKAKQIDAASRAAKFTSCNSEVCVGIDDFLDTAEPGQKISVKAWITVPAGKNFKLANYTGGYGYLVTWVDFGSRYFSPTNAREIVFPDGRTEFTMYVTVPENPTSPNIYEAISLSGRLINSDEFGYGSGYGYSNNQIYLYASHGTPIISQPPKLVSQYPASGANGVPLNAKITATFDKPLNPSIVSMSVDSEGHYIVSGTIAYESDNKTISFTPNNMIQPGTEYKARIHLGGIGSDTHSVVWSFTTTTTKPPVVKISSPTNGSTTSQSNIMVQGSVSDPDTQVQQLVLKVNNQITPINSNGSFSQKVDLSKSNNTVTVIATDPEKNQDTKTITVTIKKAWYCIFGFCR